MSPKFKLFISSNENYNTPNIFEKFFKNFFSFSSKSLRTNYKIFRKLNTVVYLKKLRKLCCEKEKYGDTVKILEQKLEDRNKKKYFITELEIRKEGNLQTL